METLYQQRKNLQLKNLMKYYRYVFNDHFTIILFFAFGGFLYFYSQVLKTMTADMWRFVPLLLSFVFLAALSFGSLATYLKEADEYYLLPKEGEMGSYLKKAFFHSLLIPVVTIIFMMALSYPLLKGSTKLDSLDLFFFGLFLISSKGWLFLRDLRQSFQKKSVNKLVLLSLIFLGLLLSFYTNFVLVGGAFFFSFLWGYRDTFKNDIFLDWSFLIEKESLRMKKIYGFISLFTDVPELPTQVRRRKFFDGLLNKVPLKQEKTYTYLYLRRLVRGGQFSGLFLSLTSFALFILLILQNLFGNLLASALFLYLLGFQLLPMYHSFEYMTLIQLYPLSKKWKKRNFQQILFYALLIEGIILSITNFFLLSLFDNLIIAGVLVVEILLFCYIYAPKRLEKGILS